MNKDKFSELFESSILETVRQFNLNTGLNISVPLQFKVYSPKSGLSNVSQSQAVSEIFISPERFYFTIDLGILIPTDGTPIGFVRVSGHDPVPFAETYNPSELGPFKILL